MDGCVELKLGTCQCNDGFGWLVGAMNTILSYQKTEENSSSIYIGSASKDGHVY